MITGSIVRYHSAHVSHIQLPQIAQIIHGVEISRKSLSCLPVQSVRTCRSSHSLILPLIVICPHLQAAASRLHNENDGDCDGSQYKLPIVYRAHTTVSGVIHVLVYFQHGIVFHMTILLGGSRLV